jgi:2-polyprenyl-3-methyl-5-hydroxy-6-metoxy-1,4-benzoquinol methylase
MTTIMQSKQNLAQQYGTFISHLFCSVAGLEALLRRNPPARIADIGCGAGWSSIGMAKAYPQVRVDGFDKDGASIEDAWAHARQERLTDRITFHTREVGDGVLNGRYDLVTAFECVFHMGNPVNVLATMRRLAGENGTVIVVDKRVDDTLHRCALGAGFREVEILPIEIDYLRFYRLYQ